MKKQFNEVISELEDMGKFKLANAVREVIALDKIENLYIKKTKNYVKNALNKFLTIDNDDIGYVDWLVKVLNINDLDDMDLVIDFSDAIGYLRVYHMERALQRQLSSKAKKYFNILQKQYPGYR